MKTYLMPFIDVSINALWSDWENFPQGRPNPLYSQQVKEWGADGLILGFLTLSPSNNACWSAQDAMPLEWAVPLSRELRDAGKRIIISFGGATNADISSKFTVSQLEDTYKYVISRYSAIGLDFDLENGLFDAQKICEAVKNIQLHNSEVSISFTLPVTPDGLTETGLHIITLAKAADLNFIINGMAMDYYDPALDNSMGSAATAAASSIRHQLASLYPTDSEEALNARIAITPMIGRNDDPSEIFTLADATLLGHFAREAGLNFVSMWSFNRDNPSLSAVADSVSSSNPEQTVPGEYTQRFRAALGEGTGKPDEDESDKGPASPGQLAYFDLTQTSLKLKWLPSSSRVVEYGIYRDLSLKGKTSSLIWEDKELLAGTEYTYFITAWDEQGRESPPGRTLNVKTLSEDSDTSPSWENVTLYLPGEMVSYKNKHYRCLQKHLSIATWTPDVAASLWERIS